MEQALCAYGALFNPLTRTHIPNGPMEERLS